MTQEDHVARGPVKQNETGFVSVHLKKGTTARYFGKVRAVYLGYYHLPEQAALTVARHHARVKAKIVQMLAARLGPVQVSAARALGGDEIKRASVEVLQVWCYQRGLDMFARRHSIRAQ